MSKIARVCSLLVRIVGALIIAFLGFAFFFQWNNPKHSSLIVNPRGNDLAPNFRGAKGEYFLNKDNLWIHYEKYLPNGDIINAKGLLVWVHGYDTHVGHYADAAQKIADATNLIVVTWDHQGWGLSEGDRLYFESLSSIRDDFVQLVQDKKKEYSITNNVFCFGHSMSGGLLVWDYLDRLQSGQPQLCQGLVLSAPGVMFDPAAESIVNGPIFDALNTLGNIFPKMVFLPLMVRASDVSSLPEFQEAWNNDPLVHSFARIRPSTILIQMVKDITVNRSKISIPYFFFLGSGDALVPTEVAQKFVESTASKDKTFKVYEGDRHSVLTDKHASDAIADISNWLKQHMK